MISKKFIQSTAKKTKRFAVFFQDQTTTTLPSSGSIYNSSVVNLQKSTTKNLFIKLPKKLSNLNNEETNKAIQEQIKLREDFETIKRDLWKRSNNWVLLKEEQFKELEKLKYQLDKEIEEYLNSHWIQGILSGNYRWHKINSLYKEIELAEKRCFDADNAILRNNNIEYQEEKNHKDDENKFAPEPLEPEDDNQGGNSDWILKLISLINTILALYSEEELKKLTSDLENMCKELKHVEKELKACNNKIEEISEKIIELQKKGFWKRLLESLKLFLGIEDKLSKKVLALKQESKHLKSAIGSLKSKKEQLLTSINQNTESQMFWKNLSLATNLFSYGSSVHGLATSAKKLMPTINYLSSILNFIDKKESNAINSTLAPICNLHSIYESRKNKNLFIFFDIWNAQIQLLKQLHDNLEREN